MQERVLRPAQGDAYDVAAQQIHLSHEEAYSKAERL